jgi:hypothetical protein
MQTSFMHSPFGFALFYLRSVAPKEPYTDKVTGKTTEPVLTSQIYWGAVPYVGIQLLMVAIVMALPWIAMHALVKKAPPPQDPAAIERPLNATPGVPMSSDGRFALPPSPPVIEGAPPNDYTGPGAPTLDMRELPRFD